MSKINLVNDDAIGVFRFLNTVDMPPKATRAKVKLLKALNAVGKDIMGDQKAIADEFGGTITDDGRIVYDTPEHRDEATTNIRILSMESRDIEEDYNGQFKVLKEFFDDYDKTIPSEFADSYIILVDELEQV